jgi:hypothetical protein
MTVYKIAGLRFHYRDTETQRRFLIPELIEELILRNQEDRKKIILSFLLPWLSERPFFVE